jgi:hypothetical protein
MVSAMVAGNLFLKSRKGKWWSMVPAVTGGVDPRIDGEGCSGDDKGAVEAAGLFTGMAIQSDGLSVVSSV